MFPFPFFGAGDAAYFEWATMTVYFKNTPTGEMRDRIIELAPPPFDLSEEDFKGRFLEAMSDQFIHASVAEAYDGELDEDTMLTDDEAFDRFNEHIEQWLRQIHKICPIVFALRPEDGEAGGTEFSEWHFWSKDQLPALLESLSTGDEELQEALSEIFDLCEVNPEDIPSSTVQRVMPVLHFAHLTASGKILESIRFARSTVTPDLILAAIRRFPANEAEGREQILRLLLPLFVQKRDSSPRADAELILRGVMAAIPEFRRSFLKRIPRLVNGHSQPCDIVNDIGVFALQEQQKGNIEQAIYLYKTALEIETPSPCTLLEVYCNALWPLQNDNTGRPVDAKLNDFFLKRCLPYAPSNPAIYFNAACLYAEMHDVEGALDCIEKAKEHEYAEFDDMITAMQATPMFDAIVKAGRFQKITAEL